MPVIHNRTTLPPLPGETEPSTAAAGDSWEQAWTNRSGWGGWGERTPTPPLPPGVLLESPLNHLRADLMESRLTWDGHPERTTVLDHEETTRWAEIQLYACSEQARSNHSEFPSFTGPQILQRLSDLEHTINQSQQERNRLRDVEAQAMAQLNDAQDATRDAAAKLDDLKAARKRLNDLLTIARERFPPPPTA
ncbi:hypothetical protein BDP27DRAFT_1435052 [Rhodocollybia butyracea]|uniref:Uncharacterized protein n=1 Tax=Rhodocollybia butyracea TaxID=206335 RepID=A0A9P5TWQ7_9AGAR|nr:hypothetical protein BDP27DRAFT_1435052 [Rhodocollybia butyracea]